MRSPTAGRGRSWLVLGLALLVLPPTAWAAMRPSTDVGDVPTAAAGRASETTAPPARDRSVDAPTTPAPTSSPQAVPGRSGLLSKRAVTAATAPTRISIPAMGVAPEVVEVGVEPDGVMEVPADVNTVGWYRFGPVPGQPGAAVIAGHVDSRSQGRGAFFDLERLAVGDRIDVSTGDGITQWEVVARRRYGKATIPLADIFTRDGPPQLVLITCGGEFDAATRSYIDNVVVYAVPVG